MFAILTLSCILGLAPMVAYTLLLWLFDRYEKEPWGLLVAAFVWGFIPSAIIALFSQIVLSIPTAAIFGGNAFSLHLVEAGLIAPVTEEAIKGAGVLLLLLIFRREFDSVFDGILYGGLVGFGFAAIENVLYFLDSGSVGGVIALAFLRAFIFGLNHAFYTSLTGIGLALARYQRNPALRLALAALGFLAAVLAHSLHNFGATYAAAGTLAGLLFSWLVDSAGIFFVFVVILLALRREGQWVSEYLEDEVTRGTLSAGQLQVAQSAARRLGDSWGAFFSGNFARWRKARRFYQQAAELAFKLHQVRHMGDEGGNQALVERLRGEVNALSAELGKTDA
jgi:RsiW-degrading membrane proteinase PrsW (M82 family)